MADREKLIEMLGNIYLPMTCGPDTIGEYRIPHKFKKEIADHLIANGVTFASDNNVGRNDVPDNNVGKWIPVTERLPEMDKVVLCYKAGRKIRLGSLLCATYADGVQAFMDYDRYFAFGATHWAPLPEPPKGE